MNAPSMVREPVDASAVLRPAVYVLRRAGRVVFVGKCKNPLSRLHAHAQHARGLPSPSMPRKPVTYDSVELRNCLIDDLDELHAQVCQELAWVP